MEALHRVLLLVDEHRDELPELHVELGDERVVLVQVPAGAGSERFRREAVDRLTQLLGLAPPTVEGSFYCTGSAGWDISTPIGGAA